MDPDDILRRAYARLLALRDNLPDGPFVSADYVEEFHGALFDLECLDYDVQPFHVRTASVTPSDERIGMVISFPSRERRVVERAMLLTKITAVLVYFELSSPSAIEEEEQLEQKELAKIGFCVPHKEP